MKLGWLLLLASALVLLSGCSKSAVQDSTLITVFYTSDGHGKLEGCGCAHAGGGITKRSAKLASARHTDPDIVYCDAGNSFSGTEETTVTKGKVMVAAYNEMGAAAVNVCERELASGMDDFDAAKKNAKFEFVSANVKYKGSLVADAYTVKKVKDARVAFVGFCGTKETMSVDSSLLPEGVTVDDPITAARGVLPGLLDKVDLLIVLSTCGDATDSALARLYPNINLIVGGRSYRPNPEMPWRIDSTRIVRPRWDGSEMGRMDMVFNDKGKIKTYSPSVAKMETTDPSDEKMLALVRGFIPGFEDHPKK